MPDTEGKISPRYKSCFVYFRPHVTCIVPFTVVRDSTASLGSSRKEKFIPLFIQSSSLRKNNIAGKVIVRIW